MSVIKRFVFAAVVTTLMVGSLVYAQSAYQSTTSAQPVVLQTQFPLVPISATAAVNNQVTLTIPAPAPNFYNYVCSLHLNGSQNGTASVNTNVTTSSTNFNSFALKLSFAATVNGNLDVIEGWGIANTGCVKSASPGTATTFVSPAAATNTAWTWSASYYQAP
jgi:hypothetical protein